MEGYKWLGVGVSAESSRIGFVGEVVISCSTSLGTLKQIKFKFKKKPSKIAL